MKEINCTKISIDVCKNDSVDFRCGGPEYLGFDFFVKSEDTEELIKFILFTLKLLNITYLKINKELNIKFLEQNLWDKKKIIKEILNDAKFLKSQISNNEKNNSFIK